MSSPSVPGVATQRAAMRDPYAVLRGLAATWVQQQKFPTGDIRDLGLKDHPSGDLSGPSSQHEDDNASGVLVGGSDVASEKSYAQEPSATDKASANTGLFTINCNSIGTNKLIPPSEANNAAEEKSPPAAEPAFGSVSDSKELYAKIDKDGNQSWTSKLPDDVDEAAENEETKKFAVIVRKKKPKVADSSKPLVIDSIIIQSPHLKAALAKILKGYPGIVTDLKKLTLSAPFECVVHRWDEFSKARSDPNVDPTTKEHLQILYDILAEDLGDLIQLREDYLRNKAVSFRHAWTLFQPGCTVISSKNGHATAFEFKQGYYAKTNCGDVYVLNCKLMEWDGNVMGWSESSLRIRDFVGTMPFTSLASYPLEYHPNAEAMKEMLTERGRRFRLLAGFRYKAYKGMGIYHLDKDTTRREEVNSRIVIDGGNWEKNNSHHAVYLSSMYSAKYEGNDCHDISEEEARRLFPLTEDQMLKATPMVRGYSLKNKRWMEFFIDDVHNIEFDKASFDSLVLPEDHKELVLACAESQVKNKNAFDDVISGKGKGIIMLLAGGPGIGKTLTAESVAEHMQVPLYSMSGGDLGANAAEVERNLSKVLQMVAHWNAVLLLDECDVFLEERSANDIERNRIVSIFLRMLEYYEGILFLTTNRVKNIDQAFESRIHISLDYPPLDAAARVAVWRGFLARAVGGDEKRAGRRMHDVTDPEISELSALDLNGRQIKNVLKTANLLACHKAELLAMKHLRTVLKAKGHSL
ncbi:LOW QUALITY PROTEIN: 26S protease regulatory subunit [Paramyrothecium foliicola]|nr:LOW QUALITY PROTEIN: 26S protease regulatory subunit [Paramyrothecium foliicola]